MHKLIIGEIKLFNVTKKVPDLFCHILVNQKSTNETLARNFIRVGRNELAFLMHFHLIYCEVMYDYLIL
jgi:hypothetical protein